MPYYVQRFVHCVFIIKVLKYQRFFFNTEQSVSEIVSVLNKASRNAKHDQKSTGIR